MSVVLLLSLVGLALVDSTSIGTLFIPVWLLLAPNGLRAGRLLGYLATIAAFYFVVGVLLVVGGTRLAALLAAGTASRPLLIAQFAVGAVLLLLSFWVEKRKGLAVAAILRWRDRAVSGASGSGALTGLALLAALAEVATMLPYLGAIGMMATADLPAWLIPVLLAGYCVVMILPAVLLLTLRAAGPRWVEALLARLDAWVLAKGGGLLSWALGIAGFLVARDAAARLWFPQLLGGG
ncbi:GAP family protein [Micromonospora sp. PLK6-60]|uniref:GAP family protein n=1 Tax=Micromonospora sp. PLK6-60 TaxID=2873383 RepID=UPI001CA6E87E|nr:GAP family protein [Micromonospora sp. PLK6-60]MBY8871014.1 GAP family protein [Micromonospora sp. PLK6-60]